MKKVFLGAGLALIIFIAVVSVVLWNNFRTENQDETYVGDVEPTLPTVSFTVLDREVDVLFGYRDEEMSATEADSLLPVSEDGIISMKISAGETLVDSAIVSLYSLDGERLLEQKEVSLTGTNSLTGEYKMTSLAETEEYYRLTIKLELSDGTESYYTLKVCQYDDDTFSDKEELISFAEDFSDSVCAKDESGFSDYLSYDSDTAGTDLHYVNISTGDTLVEWAELEVTKQEQTLRIYEWYDTQVSIALEYDAKLVYGDEETTARVSENLCVRERDDTLYLLGYERYASEYFTGTDAVGTTSIVLGIQQPDTMELLYTDYGINVYFSADGSVWHYNYNSNELVSVFSFGDGSSDIRLNSDKYEVSLCGIYDGSLYFTVTGYMESGDHEGEMGFSLLAYDISKKECRELMYSELTCSENEAALTAISDDGLFYVNLGDAIYALDLSGKEILKLYEGIDASTIMVSESGDLIAWQYTDDDRSIYLLNTGTAALSNVGALEGLEILGFVGDDIVFARYANYQIAKEGFSYTGFYDMIFIADDTLKSKTEYEKDDIIFCDVTLSDTGLTFARYQIDGDECTQIEDDVLSLAKDEEESMVVELKVATSDAKRNYYYINLGRTVSAGDATVTTAELVLSEPVRISPTAGESDTATYQAYLFGKVVCSTNTLSEAIAAVYDGMGNVYCGSYLSDCVWNRDARDLYLTITLPTMSWTLEGHEEEMAAMNSLERGVDIFVYAGVNAGIIDEEAAESEERENCETVYDELTLLFGDNLIDLTGSDVSYLLYYINLRHPVLCLTDDDESLIITGYTSTELSIYDPATRETSTVTQEDAQEYFDAYNTIFLSF